MIPDTRPIKSVGVVGLGYVGLPLAVAFAESGMSVIGVDTNPETVSKLKTGNSHIEDIPADSIHALVGAGRLRPTTNYTMLREAEAILICLPTPLDAHREPDLSIVVSAAQAIAENLRPGTLVVLESTTYPGTTREVLLPILEHSKYRVGEDFHLAFSPERVDPGNLKFTLQNIPKVVGAMTPACAARAKALYTRVTEEVFILSSPESAELSKLLENIFRGVNIALVNELAILCDRMGVDVWEVIEAANTKPFGFMAFYPGPGLGGHCIPVDPFYLSWRARAFDVNTEFIELAGRVNTSMPYYALSRITAALNGDKKAVNGSRILILGVSYKPDVGDLRESPALKILELLVGSGAKVTYHDPYIPYLPDHKLASVELTKEELEQTDCVVIATDHRAVRLRPVVSHAPKVVDLRNAVRRELGELPDSVDVL